MTLAACALGCSDDWTLSEMLRRDIDPAGTIPDAAIARGHAQVGAKGPSGGRRRVWLVGVDGFSPMDFSLRRGTHPFETLERLAHEGRSTLDAIVPGGPELCGEGARFDSAPGWANILTGHDCRDHRVVANDATDALLGRTRELPSLLATARGELGLVTAAVGGYPIFSDDEMLVAAGYPPQGLLGVEGFASGSYASLDGWTITMGADAVAEAATLEAIVKLDADLVFTHFDEPDHVGHAHGFGSAGWAKRLDRTDRRIGRVLAAIQGIGGDHTADSARGRAFAQEDWLIVIVSDHGGHDTPGCHGGLRCCIPGLGSCGSHDIVSGVDDRVPFILWTTGGRATALAPLQEPVSQLDVRPTVLAWLGGTDPDAPGLIQGVRAIGTPMRAGYPSTNPKEE